MLLQKLFQQSGRAKQLTCSAFVLLVVFLQKVGVNGSQAQELPGAAQGWWVKKDLSHKPGALCHSGQKAYFPIFRKLEKLQNYMGKIYVSTILDFFFGWFQFLLCFSTSGRGGKTTLVLQRLTIQIHQGEMCKKSLERMLRMWWELRAAQMWRGNTIFLFKKNLSKTPYRY